MIAGTIIFEDVILQFSHVATDDNGELKLEVEYTVCDVHTGESEKFTVPHHKFFKALAIAVHVDGLPDHNKDYRDAESIQGKIRWIP